MNKKENIKKNLPSKVVMFVVIGVFIVMLVITLMSDSKKQVKNDKKMSLEKITINAINGVGGNSKDTDNDGISDYEERLDGTDPNKQDTDGDGVSDYLEKKLNTNPLIKKENDPIVKKKQEELKNKKITLTQAVGRDLFLEALKYSRKENMTKEEYDSIVSQVYKKNLPKNPLMPKYTEKDLNSSEDITLMQYKNSFISVAAKLDLKKHQDERIMVAEYVSSYLEEDKKNAQKSIDDLKELEKDILNMKIPTMAIKNHLTYLNSLNLYIKSLQKIIDTVKDDPIMTMVYLKNLDELQKIFVLNKELIGRLYFR